MLFVANIFYNTSCDCCTKIEKDFKIVMSTVYTDWFLCLIKTFKHFKKLFDLIVDTKKKYVLQIVTTGYSRKIFYSNRNYKFTQFINKSDVIVPLSVKFLSLN